MQIVNFKLRKGDTFNLELDFSDFAGQVNFTGATFTMTARTAIGEPVAFQWLNLGFGGYIVDLTKSAAATAGYTAGTYVYDGKITQTNGTVTTVIEGTIEVLETVT